MALIAKNLYFRYQKDQPFLLENINLELHSGECLALLGANGSGKTTLSKILIGIIKPEKGQISVDGQKLESLSLAKIGERVGYLFQNPNRQLFCSSVEEEVGFALQFRNKNSEENREKVTELLKFFDLDRLREKFPFTLSQGERQRLALAAIMALDPPFFILDEPTTGLDPRRKEELYFYLHKLLQKNRGILLISHDHQFAGKLASCVRELKKGQLMEGVVQC